ncbi:hypothetical protein OIU78_027088 [Salix suchowensis]|nr:hypothetical protein OIU78_027088 [Salix suchowensis]
MIFSEASSVYAVTFFPPGLPNFPENPVASIGLYLDCGSVYESPFHAVPHALLEWMAFKSTSNRSHLCNVREIEAIGGNEASREQMGYTF